jgi:uncharacterized protein
MRSLHRATIIGGGALTSRGSAKAAGVRAENLHLDPEKAAARLDERLRELTVFRLDEETPLPYAKHVKVPTLMVLLRRDLLIHAERVGQATFDALGAQEKELLWIEESNQRFYAYNHFGQHPERRVGWFNAHM